MYHFLILIFTLFFSTPEVASIEVAFYNIKKAKGSLRVAVFDDAEKFDARSPMVFATVVAINSKEDIKVQIPDLTAGKTYAIAAFQDLNDNGELDTNMFGIPTEPYAFSNNPKVKWQAPTFAEAAFKAEAVSNMRLRLASWSDR